MLGSWKMALLLDTDIVVTGKIVFGFFEFI
jgi:hypothetical protein